ncbi:hypothetical protein B7R87_32930 [Streptomyces tsukubensis]|nr:hypothetical protein B7R87_32930 [Streptomyces tsukubensis]
MGGVRYRSHPGPRPRTAPGRLHHPVWLLTRGAVRTGTADATTSPAQSAVWGLGRAVGLEHPGLWGGLADLPAEFTAETGTRLAAVLADPGHEDQIALRGNAVLVRRLSRALPAPAPRRPWSPRGTVLLTGGTGSVGTHIATWLARQGTRRLVLTSRSGPSAPGQPPWPQPPPPAAPTPTSSAAT